MVDEAVEVGVALQPNTKEFEQDLEDEEFTVQTDMVPTGDDGGGGAAGGQVGGGVFGFIGGKLATVAAVLTGILAVISLFPGLLETITSLLKAFLAPIAGVLISALAPFISFLLRKVLPPLVDFVKNPAKKLQQLGKFILNGLSRFLGRLPRLLSQGIARLLGFGGGNTGPTPAIQRRASQSFLPQPGGTAAENIGAIGAAAGTQTTSVELGLSEDANQIFNVKSEQGNVTNTRTSFGTKGD